MRRLIVLLVLLVGVGCEGEAPPSGEDAGGIVARGAEWSRGRVEPVADGGL